MAEETTADTNLSPENKYQIGPGLGLLLMGVLYLIFWISPLVYD